MRCNCQNPHQQQRSYWRNCQVISRKRDTGGNVSGSRALQRLLIPSARIVFAAATKKQKT